MMKEILLKSNYKNYILLKYKNSISINYNEYKGSPKT